MSTIRFRKYNVVVFLFLFFGTLYYLNCPTQPFSPETPGFTPSEHQSPGKIQYPFPRAKNSQAQTGRLEKVKAEFLHSWNGYKKHAWMMDELRPLSGGNATKFCGWAATLVDTLDTLWIMGLEKEYREAVDAALTIDFSTAEHCTVNLFEVTIRHLGGLLAAYDLSGRKDSKLLKKTVEVGELLYAAFDTYNGMPINHYAWPKNERVYSPPNSIALAAIGSLNLEFTQLSEVTNNPKYYLATEKISQELALAQPYTKWPGMWPVVANSAGPGGLNEFTSQEFSLGALADSTYEYLPKAHLMFGDKSDMYETMYRRAIPEIYEHLVYRPMTPDSQDILFTGKVQGTHADKLTLRAEVQHLACFQGGMFGLASKVFNRPEDMVTAQKLTEGCVWAYRMSPSGIMPESFQTIACEDRENCTWDQDVWDKALVQKDLPLGFRRIDDGRYLLRPEAIESVFLMWRMTGNTYWREAGWEMFESIVKNCRTSIAYAAVDHVMDAKPFWVDEVESFWFAETLKYFYLLFADTDLISLDEYVLNTEAHPLKLRKWMK